MLRIVVSAANMTRDATSLPKTETRGGFDCGRRSNAKHSRPADQSLPSANGLAHFLQDVVIDQLTRERTADHVARGNASTGTEPRSVRAHSEAKADLKEQSSVVAIPRWKRFLDFLIISAGLPLWLPVMFVIMLAIKLGSQGPVFYRQQRIGYRGRRFLIFKFRTMKVNVETSVHESHFERLMMTDVPMVKLDAKGDPRLIKFGRFLRAAGLDELPQIFNVLRGEMSLVGPRPCTAHEFERYQPWQRERVDAPPGLTGFWQVNGKNNTTFSEMIDMDILYGNNMSLRLDLLILLKTIPAMISQVLETTGISWKTWSKQSGFPQTSPVLRNLPGS